MTSEDDEIDAEMFGAKIPAKTTQALQSKEIPEETLEQLESAPTTPSLMQRQ